MLLKAAQKALTDSSGTVPPLEQIAHRACLGRSTLYRNFPDRHELGHAVITGKLRELKAALTAVVNGHRTFRSLLAWVLATQLEMRPLVALIRQLPLPAQQVIARRLARVLTPAFESAQSSGELRPDVRPSDLLMILAMLESAASQAALITPAVDAPVSRMITVLLDGLFTTSANRGEAPQ